MDFRARETLISSEKAARRIVTEFCWGGERRSGMRVGA